MTKKCQMTRLLSNDKTFIQWQDSKPNDKTFIQWQDFYPMTRLKNQWQDLKTNDKTFIQWQDLKPNDKTFIQWHDFYQIIRVLTDCKNFDPFPWKCRCPRNWQRSPEFLNRCVLHHFPRATTLIFMKNWLFGPRTIFWKSRFFGQQSMIFYKYKWFCINYLCFFH